MARLTILSKPTFAQIWVNKPKAGLNFLRLAGCLALLLLLTACAGMQDPESSQDHRDAVIATVQPGQVFEQTFNFRRADLQNLLIWLKVDAKSLPAEARLYVDFYRQSNSSTPEVSFSYDLQKLNNDGALNISLKKAGEILPAGGYRLKLRMNSGAVQVLGRAEDAYAQGTSYINDLPIDADISFRLTYRYSLPAILEDLSAWLSQLWLVLPLLVILWLPGRLLLRLTNWDRRLDWGERSAASVGLSISLIPLLMLWTSTLGLHWSRGAVIVGALVLAASYIYLLHPLNWRPEKIKINGSSLALATVFLFSLAVRLAMVRDLAAPAWVDSVHHALIARLIMEQGSLPHTYAPYLQITTTSYHAGYHSVLATFTWLSSLGLEQAMLLIGQVLNALAVLAVYLLTTTFTQRRSAGIFAALIAGLATPMPAYYTSWGRYTQLTGLLILPVAFFWIKGILDDSLPIRLNRNFIRAKGWPVALACASIAGVLLVHYRVLAFLAALIAAYCLIAWVQEGLRRRGVRKPGVDLLNLGLIGVFVLLLTLPWWPATVRTFVLPVASFPGTSVAFSDFAWSYLTTALGKYALGLAGLGFLWSLVQRKTIGIVMALWVALMFFIANLGVFGLPGGSLVNNTSVAISLFMPTALLGGYILGWSVDGWAGAIPHRWVPAYWGGVGLACIALAILGARALLPILNPGTLLVREADLPAIDWVEQNIPEGETILINPFVWGWGVYAGSDGGYWITPLTGRATLPPPAIYNYDFTRAIAEGISQRAQTATELATKPEALHDFLNEQAIRYVFIGVRGGPLSAKALNESPLFERLYAQDGASIFKVK